jgi:16S rRNA (cytosine967-C5)-methyltransferase
MSARGVAITRITHAARRFPDTDLRIDDRDLEGLEARDAALAAAIEHNVLRRWLTLAAVLQRCLSRPWDEVELKLQAALLCGAAQLLLMDRLPDYAVIDETVEWAKANIRPKAGGMVNAVLRKVASLRGGHRDAADLTALSAGEMPLHDGRVLALNMPVFAEEALPRLAQQTSHALELLEHWIGLFGLERARRIALHDLVHAPIIVHGLSAAQAARVDAQPHEEPGFFVLPAHAPVQALLMTHQSAIVQDPTSAAAVSATGPLLPSPGIIIDVCAGRGTKTRQLARMHPQARIVATDIDADRLASLQRQFEGHDRVQVIKHGGLPDFAGQADVVLLDVPCSNSGVLARRVEAKHRFSREKLKKLVEVQRQIMADSLRLLRPRGGIIYSTCSVDATENHQQAQWLTKWHPFTIEVEASREPAGLPGEAATAYRDGGYWALLRRKA